MKTNEISMFYTSAANVLNSIPATIKKEDEAFYEEIKTAAECILKNAQKQFQNTFPEHFEDAIKDKDFYIADFYKMIAKNPTILQEKEVEFLNFVKEHVEIKVFSSQNLLFNWHWEDIYNILSSSFLKKFIVQNAPKEFETLVISIGKHIDVLQKTNTERAILFFTQIISWDGLYEDLTEKVISSLKENPCYEEWIRRVLLQIDKN